MLSDRCPVYPILSVCLSVCLSVTLAYQGQTVGWIMMPLGMEVGHGPGHIVLDGDSAPPPKKMRSQHSSRVGRRSRRGFLTDCDIFRRRIEGVVMYFFQFRLQIFRRRVRMFSHFFVCCFYFLFKVHANF